LASGCQWFYSDGIESIGQFTVAMKDGTAQSGFQLPCLILK
jgi:hypothetical protein